MRNCSCLVKGKTCEVNALGLNVIFNHMAINVFESLFLLLESTDADLIKGWDCSFSTEGWSTTNTEPLGMDT